AFLGQELISDPDFGNKKWLCSVDLEKLRENLVWLTQNLVYASEDYRRVFPNQASSLDAVHGDFAGLLSVPEEMKSNAPAGTNTGIYGAQLKMRKALSCNGEAPAPRPSSSN